MNNQKYLELRDLVKAEKKEFQEVLIINIGTDRSTGDSIAPMVGTLLENVNLKKIKVYGTLEEPIHALNLEEKVEEINKNHTNAFIIGIDATISEEKVGTIFLGKGGIKPGDAFKKKLPKIGNIHIKPVVTNVPHIAALSSVRLSLIFKMAEEIKEIIKKLDNYLYRKEKRKEELKEVAATSNKK